MGRCNLRPPSEKKPNSRNPRHSAFQRRRLHLRVRACGVAPEEPLLLVTDPPRYWFSERGGRGDGKNCSRSVGRPVVRSFGRSPSCMQCLGPISGVRGTRGSSRDWIAVSAVFCWAEQLLRQGQRICHRGGRVDKSANEREGGIPIFRSLVSVCGMRHRITCG